MSQDPLKELLPTISKLTLEVLLSCWSEARKIQVILLQVTHTPQAGKH